jgi:hypothetical protein
LFKKFRSRRPRTSLTLIAGAVLLLLAIAVGQRLGDRVLSDATEHRIPILGPVTTPVPVASDANDQNWKHEQVVSVATDPAFPDPRATRPPTPKPTPPPTPKPTPTPAPTPSYSSPPLPIPIVSHAPGEVQTEPPVSPPPSP